MKLLTLCLVLLPAVLHAQAPEGRQLEQVSAVTVSSGVILKEVTGHSASGSAGSDKNSVARFHLEPGCASAWSHSRKFFLQQSSGSAGELHEVSPYCAQQTSFCGTLHPRSFATWAEWAA